MASDAHASVGMSISRGSAQPSRVTTKPRRIVPLATDDDKVGPDMLKRSCILIAVVACNGLAQPTPRKPHPLADSSAGQIMAHVRARGMPATRELVGDILRQKDKPQERSKLDALSDSLVAEIVSTSRLDSLRQPDAATKIMPVSILLSASAVLGRAVEGVPYAGGLDRLIRIHREASPKDGSRGLVVRWYLCTGDFNRGLAALRDIAISRDVTAVYAMDELITTAVEGGNCQNPPAERARVEATLRDVYSRDMARDPEAGTFLAGYASRQGWKRP